MNDFKIENNVLKKYSGGESKVVIPEGITTIGSDAFANNTGLTEVHIPKSVTTIEKRAFKDCAGLTYLHIEPGVTMLALQSFSGCTALEGVRLPDGVKTISGIAHITAHTRIRMWSTNVSATRSAEH